MSVLPDVVPRVIVEQRGRPGTVARIAIPAASIAGAVLVSSVFLALSHHAPVAVFQTIIQSSLTSYSGFTATLVYATPLIFTACAACASFRMMIWNIGQEGQLYLGAIFYSGMAILIGGDLTAWIVVPLALGVGALGGAIWAAIAALPRAWLGTSEIITTLMLNFVALSLMNFLIFDVLSPWRDPAASSTPQGLMLASNAALPSVGGVNIGFILAVLVALGLWRLLSRTRWGFELRLVGDSPATARYAGLHIPRKVISVLSLSGALAGLGGAVLVGSVLHSLDPTGISTQQLGFTGIIVAALARMSPIGSIAAAILFGVLINSNSSLQIAGVPVSIVATLEGTLLVLVVAGEFLVRYRVRLAKTKARGSSE